MVVQTTCSEEPGDTGIECFQAEIPKGRRFIAIIYDLELYDHIDPPAGRADTRFDKPLTVSWVL